MSMASCQDQVTPGFWHLQGHYNLINFINKMTPPYDVFLCKQQVCVKLKFLSSFPFLQCLTATEAWPRWTSLLWTLLTLVTTLWTILQPQDSPLSILPSLCAQWHPPPHCLPVTIRTFLHVTKHHGALFLQIQSLSFLPNKVLRWMNLSTFSKYILERHSLFVPQSRRRRR